MSPENSSTEKILYKDKSRGKGIRIANARTEGFIWDLGNHDTLIVTYFTGYHMAFEFFTIRKSVRSDRNKNQFLRIITT